MKRSNVRFNDTQYGEEMVVDEAPPPSEPGSDDDSGLAAQDEDSFSESGSDHEFDDEDAGSKAESDPEAQDEEEVVTDHKFFRGQDADTKGLHNLSNDTPHGEWMVADEGPDEDSSPFEPGSDDDSGLAAQEEDSSSESGSDHEFDDEDSGSKAESDPEAQDEEEVVTDHKFFRGQDADTKGLHNRSKDIQHGEELVDDAVSSLSELGSDGDPDLEAYDGEWMAADEGPDEDSSPSEPGSDDDSDLEAQDEVVKDQKFLTDQGADMKGLRNLSNDTSHGDWMVADGGPDEDMSPSEPVSDDDSGLEAQDDDSSSESGSGHEPGDEDAGSDADSDPGSQHGEDMVEDEDPSLYESWSDSKLDLEAHDGENMVTDGDDTVPDLGSDAESDPEAQDGEIVVNDAGFDSMLDLGLKAKMNSIQSLMAN